MKLIPVIASGLVITVTCALANVRCEENQHHIIITRNGKHVLTYHKTVKIPPGIA